VFVERSLDRSASGTLNAETRSVVDLDLFVASVIELTRPKFRSASTASESAPAISLPRRRRQGPRHGGFKYNPPTGGPADTTAMRWIEGRANDLLSANQLGVSRVDHAHARRAATTHPYDYVGSYVDEAG